MNHVHDSQETTPVEDAWHKLCVVAGKPLSDALGDYFSAVFKQIADQRIEHSTVNLGGKTICTYPVVPEVDVPESLDSLRKKLRLAHITFGTWDAVANVAEAEITRRVAEADRKLIVDRDVVIHNYEAATQEADELRQQLAAATAEVERLKRDASVAEDIATIANQHGWNGVDNSKFLSVFIEDALNDHRRLRDEKRKDVEQLLDENKKLREENARLSRPVEGVDWDDLWGRVLCGGLRRSVEPAFLAERNAREAAEAERDELRDAVQWYPQQGNAVVVRASMTKWSVSGGPWNDSHGPEYSQWADAVLAAYRAEKAKVQKADGHAPTNS